MPAAALAVCKARPSACFSGPRGNRSATCRSVSRARLARAASSLCWRSLRSRASWPRYLAVIGAASNSEPLAMDKKWRVEDAALSGQLTLELAGAFFSVERPFPPRRFLLRRCGGDAARRECLASGLRRGDEGSRLVVLVDERAGHRGEPGRRCAGHGCATAGEGFHGFLDRCLYRFKMGRGG